MKFVKLPVFTPIEKARQWGRGEIHIGGRSQESIYPPHTHDCWEGWGVISKGAI